MIICDNVHKTYPLGHGRKIVLNGLDLVIRPGEHVGFLRKERRRKTTLIRLIGQSSILPVERSHGPCRLVGRLALAEVSGQPNGIRRRPLHRCILYGRDIGNSCEFVEDFTELGQQLRCRSETSPLACAPASLALSLAIEFDCYMIDEVTHRSATRFPAQMPRRTVRERGDRALSWRHTAGHHS